MWRVAGDVDTENRNVQGITVLWGTVAALTGAGLLESLRHRAQLTKLKYRIHVNGTRGKSSVTRLIASGLRAGNIRTCAKTTGTLPRMIMPDGSEFPVFRPSKANVIEQTRIVSNAVEANAAALVMECMALIPSLQWLSENKLVRATHAVITNARADHLDVMGPTEVDVAKALAGMIPVGGKIFTAERKLVRVFEEVAKERRARLIAITDEDVERITPLELAGFSYLEHAENLALSLRVCQDIGVDRATALQGMWNCRPDPGAMTEAELDFFGRKIWFVNGFAANDPESTERIWRMALERHTDVHKRIAIFNCRGDRPDRSRQLAEVVANWPLADHYVLIGSGTYIFAKYATKSGIDPLKLAFGEDLSVEEIFEMIVELSGSTALVMGMANIGGPGLGVTRYFANRSKVSIIK
ncbi:MAG TPA: poly-gamma-glutamate synthase PgsB [Pirellulaceae bacterium]